MRNGTIEDLDAPGRNEYFEVVKSLDNLEYGNLEDFLSACKEEVSDDERLLIRKTWPIKTFIFFQNSVDKSNAFYDI